MEGRAGEKLSWDTIRN